MNSKTTYFLKCNGYVKIGTSHNVDSRKESIQSHNPYEIKLLGVTHIPEAVIHKKFAHLHERGEWYHLTAEIKEFIANPIDEPTECEKNEVPTTESAPKNDLYEFMCELEREYGVASIAKILEATTEWGRLPEDVKGELRYLWLKGYIFEPTSGNYRITNP